MPPFPGGETKKCFRGYLYCTVLHPGLVSLFKNTSFSELNLTSHFENFSTRGGQHFTRVILHWEYSLELLIWYCLTDDYDHLPLKCGVLNKELNRFEGGY